MQIVTRNDGANIVVDLDDRKVAALDHIACDVDDARDKIHTAAATDKRDPAFRIYVSELEHDLEAEPRVVEAIFFTPDRDWRRTKREPHPTRPVVSREAMRADGSHHRTRRV